MVFNQEIFRHNRYLMENSFYTPTIFTDGIMLLYREDLFNLMHIWEL